MRSKTVFITGASSGIGQAIIGVLKQDKWDIIKPSHAELDLNDLKAINTYTDNLRKKVDHLDAFIHVAGVWHDDNKVLADKNLSGFTQQQIIKTMNVGIVSAMLLLSKLLSIINRGTIIGITGTFDNGAAGWLPYYTSKRALEDFLVGLSHDYPSLKSYGISPSDTATPAYRRFYPQYIADSQSPSAVSDLVLQLLSGNSNFQSGDIVEVKHANLRTGFHT